MARNRRRSGKGLVLVDYGRLKVAILNLGLSETDFAAKVGISTHTMDRLRRGEGVRPCILKAVADFLGRKPEALLADDQIWTGYHRSAGQQSSGHREWDVDEEIGDWVQRANGLRYRIFRLRHRQMPERFARGKCYELGRLATAEDHRLRALLLRHPRICGRFRGHPHIPLNLGVFPENGGKIWWVIDEWHPGPTLAAALQIGPLQEKVFPTAMKQIAEGLRALHGAAIIRRELAPWNILLRQGDSLVVLTDFEQSKLLDGSPTVSPTWVEDPYRAPETSTTTRLDGRADLFSWGRVFTHAATGWLPELGQEKEALERLQLPAAVRTMVLRCVVLPFDERPKSIETVLAALRDWH